MAQDCGKMEIVPKTFAGVHVKEYGIPVVHL